MEPNLAVGSPLARLPLILAEPGGHAGATGGQVLADTVSEALRLPSPGRRPGTVEPGGE